jgi:hypothetical protein
LVKKGKLIDSFRRTLWAARSRQGRSRKKGNGIETMGEKEKEFAQERKGNWYLKITR